MNMIIDNWELGIAIASVIALIIESLVCFVEYPYTKKIDCLKQWLLYAVVEAEKKFKGGTGTVKLRYVYNLAIEKFPWLPTILTFNQFSEYVDEALIWLEGQLNSNKNVKDYIDE